MKRDSYTGSKIINPVRKSKTGKHALSIRNLRCIILSPLYMVRLSNGVKYMLLFMACISFYLPVRYALGGEEPESTVNTQKISTAQSIMNNVIIALLKKDIDALKQIKSYHCTFIKQEMFNGKLSHTETISYYYEAPCSIYMKWTNEQEKGLVAVYNCKKDKNHFKGKDSGIAGYLGFMKFKLKSNFVKAFHPNHWQINQSDIIFMTRMILEQMEDSIKAGQFRLNSIKAVHDDEAGVDALRFDAFLSDRPVDGILYSKASIWVDSDTLIPVKLLLYNFKGELYERYILKDMKLNVDIPRGIFVPVR